MSSTDATVLSDAGRATLLQVARDSIVHGIDRGSSLAVNADDYPPELRPLRATFVTLERGGQLRGCIGILEAMRPLVEDVAYNAHAAAFSDPRFPPLARDELADLSLHISILSPPEPMHFASEEELLAQIRPGVDGLILQDGFRRGTFLPSVWESLPQPREFLRHLKLKAGLPVDYWSPTVEVARYTADYIE